jgi:Uncharacterized protein conserved in bacteria (DUF2252)
MAQGVQTRVRPLFLQIKEAGKSVLERLGPKFKGHQGQRVVEGQRVMQAASDVFLGWTEDIASHRQFYVRQLKNRRLGSISELVEGEALASYARLCGRTLARAHARSADPAALAGYMARAKSLMMRWLHLRWPMRGARKVIMNNSRRRKPELNAKPPDQQFISSNQCPLLG